MSNPFPPRNPSTFGVFPVTAGVRGRRVAQLALWYDPTDITTLFQDLAMTVPVDTPGQTVEAVADKSGNGYHLDAAAIGGGTGKPTYVASATGSLPALAFDRSFNGNLGQVIRTSRADISIPGPWIALGVANWQVPGFGFEGLLLGIMHGRLGHGRTTGGVLVTGPDSVTQLDAVDGDHAAWVHAISPTSERCSLNTDAGVAENLASNDPNFDLVVNAPIRLALGGNQNGGAGNSGWNGTISEVKVWNEINLPTEDFIEDYITGKYGLAWS